MKISAKEKMHLDFALNARIENINANFDYGNITYDQHQEAVKEVRELIRKVAYEYLSNK